MLGWVTPGTMYTDMAYHIYLKPLPSKEILNTLLRYENETGYLYWKNTGKLVASCSKDLGNRYKRIMIDKKHYVLHRIVYQMHYGDLRIDEVIDHIDRNKQNNKIQNLRRVDVFINNQNQGNRRNNTSGYKGVSWSKQKQKWRATITVKRHQKTLGFFKSKEEAFECYQKAKQCFHACA